MTGAVLFDLDDTLYRERRFMLSGFAAVADLVAVRTSMTARQAFGIMLAAARRGHRSQAFQRVSAASGGPAVEDLVECYRTHSPRLRLPRATRAVLQELHGFALGIVTNGLPAVQARKVRTLGLEALVTTVVYADACGSGRGKPDPVVFHEALSRLGVPAGRAVFVGDNPSCDIAGARAVGLSTILMARRTVGAGISHADVVVQSVRWVPASVRGLLQARAA